jgi:hypothetical protein
MSEKSVKEALLYQSEERLKIINSLCTDYEKRLKALEEKVDRFIKDSSYRNLFHRI